MVVKEAWRVDRERGTLPEETVHKMKRAHKIGTAVGAFWAGLWGMAIILTVVAVLARLFVLAWQWILSPL